MEPLEIRETSSLVLLVVSRECRLVAGLSVFLSGQAWALLHPFYFISLSFAPAGLGGYCCYSSGSWASSWTWAGVLGTWG